MGMSQGERQGRGYRRTGHGLSKGQGHREEVKWSSLEGQEGKDIGRRERGWVVRGWGPSGWQIRDLAGRSLEERIKGSEAGV